MFKAKDKLKIKPFIELDEDLNAAKVSEAADQPKAVPVTLQFDEDDKSASRQPDTPRKKKIPHVRIYIAALAVIGLCAVASVCFGMWETGNIGIDELTAKNVTVNVNSTPQVVATNAATVAELLDELDITIGKKDYMDKKWDQEIVDGMNIWIRLSIPITVNVDNKIINIETQPVTVERALKLAGITARPSDDISLPLLSYVYEPTEIVVDRVDVVTETVDEYIEQGETTREQSYLAPGARVVISEGSPGVNRNTYEVVYENGVEIERTLISTEKVRDPVDRVVGIGSANSTGTATSAMATSSDGASFYYRNSYTVETTAYTWTGNRTATGTWPKVGTIAVDPRVIPLGTKVYISGYGFATAEDTGGAIKGNIVDLYMDTEQACINWGRRNVTIYILE